jgi:phage baseplate assembly protein W
MFGYSPVLPLQVDKQDGIALTKTHEQVAKQNLEMLLLTNPGERIMYPDFGVGLKRVLFELDTPALQNEIHRSIVYQVKQYLPYIQIGKIDVQNAAESSQTMDLFEPEHTYVVTIQYSVNVLGINDIVLIEI